MSKIAAPHLCYEGHDIGVERRFSVNIAGQEEREREEERGGAVWERAGGEVKLKIMSFRYYEKLRNYWAGLRTARL